MITVEMVGASGETAAAGESLESLGEFVLAHGADPESELASRGFVPVSVTASGRAPRLTLTYAVERGPVLAAPRVDDAVRVGALHPGIVWRQRLAAYAVVVVDHRYLLLTELSGNVSGGAGLWVLPGGGLDPGEEPRAAIVREVWEETGQVVDRVALEVVTTSHRPDSRGAMGERVDFHAVRLIHTARCPAPTEPVVHDIGGSTAGAAWVPLEELSSRPLALWVTELLRDRPDLFT